MIAEQDFIRLKESRARVEKLLSYYRGMGEREMPFVEELERRLRAISDALRGHSGSVAC